MVTTQWHEYCTSFCILETGWHYGCWCRTFNGNIVRTSDNRRLNVQHLLNESSKEGRNETVILRDKRVPVSLCSPHIPYGLHWQRTRATVRKASDKSPDTTTFILVDFKMEGCCCGQVYRRITNVRWGVILHTELTALNLEFFWLSTECMNIYIYCLSF